MAPGREGTGRRGLPSYECAPGAARRPLPTSYARRQPERLSLHEVVTEHLESFLEELARE